MFRTALTTNFKAKPLSISFNLLRRAQSTIPLSFKETVDETTPLNTTPNSPDSYPEVPREYYYHRSPDQKYFDQQNRRDFNQPLHLDDDVLNLWSPHLYEEVSDSTAVKWQLYFFGCIGLFSAGCYWYTGGKPQRKAVPRQYPDGLVKDLGGDKVYVDKTFYD